MSGRPPQWDWRRHQPACVPAWRGSLILAELAECGLLTVEELCFLQVPTPGRWAAAVRELEAALGPSR